MVVVEAALWPLECCKQKGAEPELDIGTVVKDPDDVSMSTITSIYILVNNKRADINGGYQSEIKLSIS